MILTILTSTCLLVHFRLFLRINIKVLGLLCWNSYVPIVGRWGQY